MNIVCLLFEEITVLDAIGPYEVLSRMPSARVTFVGKQRGLVRSDNRMLALQVDAALSEVTSADLLLVPGGFGARRLAKDLELADWLRAIDRTTRITASVCTGALLLASAGLLHGKSATTHWAFLEQLASYGAVPQRQRYVRDGKYATAAGVSAGIDLALALALELFGPDVAQAIQLSIEYDPDPPLQAGRPEQVAPALRDRLFARNHARDHELV